MIGLEYILKLSNIQHSDLAKELGIKKQNINMWIKCKQNIPIKHIPKLVLIFSIEGKYYQKELTDTDKIDIQIQKLSNDLEVKEREKEIQFSIRNQDLIQIPVYDNDEINKLILKKEKIRILEQYQDLINRCTDDHFLLLTEQMSCLLDVFLTSNNKEHIISDTLDALSHYFSILPEWVGEHESDDIINNLLKAIYLNDKNKKL